MRKALLIGFQYENGKKLPGITTDLYQVYCFLKKHGWQDHQIKVMTDIVKDETTDILKTSILEKIVNSDILTFIEDCQERGQYILFKSHHHYNNFSTLFENKESNYFIYYTGHSKDGNIILPDQALISLDRFREYINVGRTICVMDCCGGGLELPFILNEGIYRFRDESPHQDRDNDFVQNEIICISSSSENEKSLTSQAGSFFTRYLFSILDEPTLSISSILKKIRKSLIDIKQTANILASFPTLRYLPGFLYSFSPLTIEIRPNHIIIS